MQEEVKNMSAMIPDENLYNLENNGELPIDSKSNSKNSGDIREKNISLNQKENENYMEIEDEDEEGYEGDNS